MIEITTILLNLFTMMNFIKFNYESLCVSVVESLLRDLCKRPLSLHFGICSMEYGKPG
jgi:hypothetical protein